MTACDKFTYSCWLRAWLSMPSSLQFWVGFCKTYDVVALFLILYLCSHGDGEPLRPDQLHCEPRTSMQSSGRLVLEVEFCPLPNDLWFPLIPVKFAESFRAKHIPTFKEMEKTFTQSAQDDLISIKCVLWEERIPIPQSIILRFCEQLSLAILVFVANKQTLVLNKQCHACVWIRVNIQIRDKLLPGNSFGAVTNFNTPFKISILLNKNVEDAETVSDLKTIELWVSSVVGNRQFQLYLLAFLLRYGGTVFKMIKVFLYYPWNEVVLYWVISCRPTWKVNTNVRL